MLVTIKSRVSRLEQKLGTHKVNVGNELIRLKELALSGKAPPPNSIEDYEAMIAECDNPELIYLYRASIRAIS